MSEEEAGRLLGERGTVSPPAEENATCHMWRWLAVALAWVLAPLTRHRHVLVPVAVSHPGAGFAGALGVSVPMVTYVLLRCDCGQGAGHLASKALPGQWTLPQVQGLPVWAEEPAGQAA